MTSPTVEPLARFCPVCRKVDDHPRHDFYLTDPAVAPHFQCCAAKGCPDGSCPIIVAGREDARGEALRKAIEKDQDKIQKALDARDEQTRTFTLADLRPEVHGAVVASPTILTGV